MRVKIWQNVTEGTELRKLVKEIVRVDAKAAPAGLCNRIMSQIRATRLSQETRAQRRNRRSAEPTIFFGVRQIRGATVFSGFYPVAKEVVLVGDFNQWKVENNPMTRGENGVWRARLVLPPGVYKYRLIVDGYWMQDPYNEQAVPNPFNEYDSVVEVKGGLAAETTVEYVVPQNQETRSAALSAG